MPVGPYPRRRKGGDPPKGTKLPPETKELCVAPEPDEPQLGDTFVYIFIFVCFKEYIIVDPYCISTCSVVVVHGGNSPRLCIWWTIGCINTYM